MKKADIARIVLWAGWTVYTIAIFILWKVPQWLSEEARKVLQWITENRLEFATYVWGAITVLLIVDMFARHFRKEVQEEKQKYAELSRLKYEKETEQHLKT